MVQAKCDFSQMTMLVVEDQEYVRSLIVQLLKRLGVGTVLEEEDGAGALSALRNLTPDLVLCDIKMTTVNGLEFLRRVRGGQGGAANCRIPIVFLTSISEKSTVEEAVANNVDGYLVKPVSLTALRSKITSVLTRRQSMLER